ncbi:MAG: pyridoxamine 5'-phosphate oxidase family protein [Deltaproteobacteria bacterium]|nr:pyridoxamine 5'-phosphate oxidase family protein [Deltaproteobacteria bacterium]
MAQFFDQLEPAHVAFVGAQPLFFVATSAVNARISLSPKGIDSFRVLAPDRVGYLDLTGSGNETAAHLQQDGRITLMFCSFSSKPLILRIYGRGRAVAPADGEFAQLSTAFPQIVGLRQLIVVDVSSVQTSCGYGVPRMDFVAQRDTLLRWAEKKGEDGLRAYRQANNRRSIDGAAVRLPDPAE